jgi:predicted transcriptional regulator
MPISRNRRRFAPNRTGFASPLGQLERLVMVAVWQDDSRPLSVSDVHSVLPQDPPIAYTTVKTTMERLAEKGILVQEKAGKAYLYKAALTETDLERRIVAATLDNLVEQFPQAVASFFARPDPRMTDEKLDLLRDAVARRRETLHAEEDRADDA